MWVDLDLGGVHDQLTPAAGHFEKIDIQLSDGYLQMICYRLRCKCQGVEAISINHIESENLALGLSLGHSRIAASMHFTLYVLVVQEIRKSFYQYMTHIIVSSSKREILLKPMVIDNAA